MANYLPRSTHGRDAGEAAPRAQQELKAPDPEETRALGGMLTGSLAPCSPRGGSRGGTMGAGDVPQGNVPWRGPRLPAGGTAPPGHGATAGTSRDSIPHALPPCPCPEATPAVPITLQAVPHHPHPHPDNNPGTTQILATCEARGDGRGATGHDSTQLRASALRCRQQTLGTGGQPLPTAPGELFPANTASSPS